MIKMLFPLLPHGIFPHLPGQCDWNMDIIVGGYEFAVSKSLDY